MPVQDDEPFLEALGNPILEHAYGSFVSVSSARASELSDQGSNVRRIEGGGGFGLGYGVELPRHGKGEVVAIALERKRDSHLLRRSTPAVYRLAQVLIDGIGHFDGEAQFLLDLEDSGSKGHRLLSIHETQLITLAVA